MFRCLRRPNAPDPLLGRECVSTLRGLAATGGVAMAEGFLKREVPGRVPRDRRVVVKKLIVGAVAAASVVASFDMLAATPSYGVLSPRRQAICDSKTDTRDSLQTSLTGLPVDAPKALKNRLQGRIDNLDAYITANC